MGLTASRREMLVSDTTFVSVWQTSSVASNVIAEAWAVLKDATRRRGRVCSDNDLWIAATGFARGVPVLTCDRDFLGLRNAGVDVIHLPRHPASSATG